jgi:hypothetical protein
MWPDMKSSTRAGLMPHGKGKLIYATGQQYEGSFVRGLPHGNGRYSCVAYEYEGKFRFFFHFVSFRFVSLDIVTPT